MSLPISNKKENKFNVNGNILDLCLLLLSWGLPQWVKKHRTGSDADETCRNDVCNRASINMDAQHC